MKKLLSDIMVRHLDCLSPQSTLAEAAALMARARISAVLVMDNAQLVGIVTERDMVKAMSSELSSEIAVTRLMTPNVLTVRQDVELAVAFRFASRHKIRHLVVADEHGQPLGMVSESDFRFHLGISFSPICATCLRSWGKTGCSAPPMHRWQIYLSRWSPPGHPA